MRFLFMLDGVSDHYSCYDLTEGDNVQVDVHKSIHDKTLTKVDTTIKKLYTHGVDFKGLGFYSFHKINAINVID